MRILFFVILIFMSGASFAQLPPDYQGLNAQEKQQVLWRNIAASPYGQMPALNFRGGPTLRQIFFSGIANAFTSPVDEIVSTRSKIIHKWGSAVLVEFRPASGHPYTGIFASGAHGVARLSLALPFQPGGEFVPGLAVKFLVDGQPSLNVTVMEKLEGQGTDTNYFRAPFSNILPDPEKLGTKFGTFAFERFVEDAIHLDVNHLSAVSANGTAVEKPRAPYQLIFQPAPGQSISSTSPDFRAELAKIPAGTSIYEIYGKDTQNAGSAVYKIGELVTSSAFVASAYEDEILYFQHAGTKVLSGFVLDRINHLP